MTWELSLTGLLIGILVGLTGMGGGSLLTPLLVLFFGFKPTVAIGTDILHGAIFKTFGAASHGTLRQVQGNLAFWMLLGSAPVSLLGVWLATWIEARHGGGVESVQGQALGAALVLGGIGFLIKAFLRLKDVGDGVVPMTSRNRAYAVAVGVAGGFIVGLTSVGSGTFFGLMMLILFPLTAQRLVGTDIAHAAALLWVAGLGHIVAGNIDFHATGWLLVGSIPGVLLGSRLSVNLPERALRVGLAVTLAVSGMKLLDMPGSDIVVLVAIGAGAATLVAWAGHRCTQRLRARPAEAG